MKIVPLRFEPKVGDYVITKQFKTEFYCKGNLNFRDDVMDEFVGKRGKIIYN